MVLPCADGLRSKEVAERLGGREHAVGKWRRRFAQAGVEGLTDEYRAGRPRTVSDAQVARAIERTLEHHAPGCDPLVDPLDGGLRLGCRIRRSLATGAVIGKCHRRHRATGFLGFLKQIDAAMPKGPEAHPVMDDHATHETPRIKAWLARRPHWHVHFTPTSASWIDQVERWFAESMREQLQRGVHRSPAELDADITTLIVTHDEKPKPCKSAKSAHDILALVKRFRQKTMSRTSDPAD